MIRRVVASLIAVSGLAATLFPDCDVSAQDSVVLYLREGWPENGQPFKKYQPDAGRLLLSPPKSLEEVWCGIWAQYDFDDTLDKPLVVERVYVNVWLYSVDGKGVSTFDLNGGFDDTITDSTAIDITPQRAKSHRYRYDQHCYYLHLDKPAVLDPRKPYSEEGSAYRFTYKWLAPRNQPIAASAPGMLSFTWLNPPPVDELQKADTDGDGIPDDAEVSEHFTNPFAPDTDADGIADPVELKGGTDPNNPDTDLDSLADGDDPNPTTPDFDATLDEPRITEDAVFESKRLLVRGGLKVDNGAVASFRDCQLFFDDSDNFQSFIAVTKGSTLSAENCRLRSIDGRILYLVNVTGTVKMVDCDLSDGYAWRISSDGSEFRKCRFDCNYKTFEIRGSKNTFEDCDFDHSHFGLHIDFRGSAQGNFVRGCRFDHSLFSAIEIHDDATANVIEDCRIARSDHAVVLKSRPGGNTVRNCRFRLNNSSVSLSSPGNLVENNHFSETAWAHITFGNGSRNIIRGNTLLNAECSLWDNCNENLFENNRFESIPGKAILLKNGASKNVFRGNVFKNISGPCIVVCRGCNDNVFENNEIIPPCGPLEIDEGAENNVIRVRTTRNRRTKQASRRDTHAVDIPSMEP